MRATWLLLALIAPSRPFAPVGQAGSLSRGRLRASGDDAADEDDSMDRELDEMMRKGATKAKTQAFEPTMRTERRSVGPARSGGSATSPRITSSFFPMGLELEKPKDDEKRKDPYKRRVPKGAEPMGAIARAQQRAEEQRAANPDALRFEGLKFDKDGLKKKPKRSDVNFLKRAAAKPELEGDEASRPVAPRAAEPAEAPQKAEQPVDFWDNFSPQGKQRKKLDFLQRAMGLDDETPGAQGE